jgi:hypothetical protein
MKDAAVDFLPDPATVGADTYVTYVSWYDVRGRETPSGSGYRV